MVDLFSCYFILFLVYVVVLIFIGVFGNCFVCYVYIKKWWWRWKLLMLFVLVFLWFDLLNNVVFFFIELFLLINYMFFDYFVLCKSFRFVMFFMNVVFFIVFIGIVIDRFIGIWCMFKMKFFSVLWVKFVVVLFIILVGLICWLSVLLYGI